MGAGRVVDDFVRVVEPYLRAWGMIVSRINSVYTGKASTRQLDSMPIAASGGGHTRKQNKSFDDVIHLQGSSLNGPKLGTQPVFGTM